MTGPSSARAGPRATCLHSVHAGAAGRSDGGPPAPRIRRRSPWR
ncbi:hypothetical protein ACFSM7_14715 [Clavibacter michiganensis subsp. tessellarius]